jgi:hypothetical protein
VQQATFGILEFGLLEKRAITRTMLEKVRSEELAGECDPTGDRHQVSDPALFKPARLLIDAVSIVAFPAPKNSLADSLHPNVPRLCNSPSTKALESKSKSYSHEKLLQTRT